MSAYRRPIEAYLHAAPSGLAKGSGSLSYFHIIFRSFATNSKICTTVAGQNEAHKLVICPFSR